MEKVIRDRLASDRRHQLTVGSRPIFIAILGTDEAKLDKVAHTLMDKMQQDQGRGRHRVQPGRREPGHHRQDQPRAGDRPGPVGAADRHRAASLRRRRPDQPLAGAGRPELRSQRAAAEVGPREGGRPGRPVGGLEQARCGRQPDHGAAAPGGRVRALDQPAGAQAPGAAAPRGDLRRPREPSAGRRDEAK